ncbi:MAG TPA: hypothetical protein VM577_18760 [Anaerovoracaceae bacterium]|nr:hypothetical protein [Anaerovoracaceae bacterium]
MLLIGSRALMFRAPQILRREPKDFDFIGYQDEIESWAKANDITDLTLENGKLISQANLCEFEIAQPDTSSALLIDLVRADSKTIETEFGLVPNFNLLFTLKASHKYLKNSPHFWKTALDYHRMKAYGAEILPEHIAFFKLREKETYTYAHPKLNVNKKDFFNGDQVEYIYDHDTIHESMKHGDRPAYLLYAKDGEEVKSDKNKFFALPEEVRLHGVLEESYVLALERSQIPHPNKLTPQESFRLALSKVCSSITSGWFREYAYENVFKAAKLYNDKYVDKFYQAVEAGVVKKL